MSGRRSERNKRPDMLPKPAAHYEGSHSRIPEAVRISFTDGTSAIYQLKSQETQRLVMTCIDTIRKWNKKKYR